ncbi:DUF4079 family protein [Myxococcota bacterium]|nr:DUF4079 family protein [Myxococcota bacterium]
MSDASTLRLLAFLHPAWMIAAIALALATASLGLRIRKQRAAGRVVSASLRRRHLYLGKLAIAVVVAGFVLGPVSMALLRHRAVFDSFHGIVGIVVAGLFLWTGHSGRALARGDASMRGLHRAVAGISIAAALLSAVAGFALLP